MLIMGIGSPLGEDAIAWEAVNTFSKHHQHYPVVTQTIDRPGALLLSHFYPHDFVILVDAMRGGFRPGEVKELQRGELDILVRPTSSHDLGLSETLGLGLMLNALPRCLRIIGIEIGEGRLSDAEKTRALEDCHLLLCTMLGPS
ncbi:hydrogenase maturation protease [Thiorhodospira sibirica]|uniref:hydrogenase maturation protease n=1 Tax=Thiorhodospira sibirica TaxID=154347 RepID=UPI00022C22CE|nr:hydrogenase maturation protease [Thiorhodospira sibirica]